MKILRMLLIWNGDVFRYALNDDASVIFDSFDLKI